MGRLLLFLIICFTYNSLIFAISLRKSDGQVEVNWSSLKVRFYGSAKVTDSDDVTDGFKSAEKVAWKDGLNQVRTQVVPYLKQNDAEGVEKFEKLVADRLARSTYSFNTTYAASGDIRVHLESRLTNAYKLPETSFAMEFSPDVSRYASTGVIFKLSKFVAPHPTYEIVDEDHNILFGVKNMSKEGYEKSLMGRWYVNPSKGEVKAFVGMEPLEVNVEVDSEGRFIVKRSLWASGSSTVVDLIAAGKVVLALPKSQP